MSNATAPSISERGRFVQMLTAAVITQQRFQSRISAKKDPRYVEAFESRDAAKIILVANEVAGVKRARNGVTTHRKSGDNFEVTVFTSALMQKWGMSETEVLAELRSLASTNQIDVEEHEKDADTVSLTVYVPGTRPVVATNNNSSKRDVNSLLAEFGL